MNDWRILDALSPFMPEVKRHRINWSKIDFSSLESGGAVDEAHLERATERFSDYCARIAADGANGVALDDLAHLYIHAGYEGAVRDKLAQYRPFYKRWFAIALKHGLQPFVNADILSYTAASHAEIGEDPEQIRAFLKQACSALFAEFPEVRGIFFRLGECDGLDVQGDFHSELVVKTPQDANKLLKDLLPLFEEGDRLLILRTWTVGAYPIGDMMWNERTLQKTIEQIDSRSFVLSMKYGESDFFRYLPVNPQFFDMPVQKLVEFQTRREYEGCGEYPSFVGYQYEMLLHELSEADNVIGSHIWCQTGGWTCFKRLTYLDKEAVWNEINTFVTLFLCQKKGGVEDAIAAWAAKQENSLPVPELVELLRLSDEAVRMLLYFDEFARQSIYFRRLRIPPQIATYWDHIFVNHTLRKVYRCFSSDPAQSIRQAHAALSKVERMKVLAQKCGLPEDDIQYMYDTFRILAAAREYALLPHREERVETLSALKTQYKTRYKHRPRYAVKLDFRRQKLRRARMQWLMNVMMRRERTYRRLDHVFTVWLLGKLYPLLRMGSRRFFTEYGDQQAMGIGTVFK